MRILFCNCGSVSMGIQYLSSVLTKAGHTTALLSAPGLESTAYWHIPVLRHLNRYSRLVKLAERFKPDLIAFSAYTSHYQFVLELSKRFKQVMDVPIVIGGSHATALPDFVLENPAMDIVGLGECEEAIVELVTKMESGEDYTNTKNFWFKKPDGEIIRNPLRPLDSDLDAIPFPDADLFRPYHYFKEDFAAVITSRGCPYSCSYCEISTYDALYGRTNGKFRRRTVDNVMEELLILKSKTKLTKVFFMDPIFLTNTGWVTEFLERYNREIDLPFMCHARPENINPQLIKALRQCSDVGIFMGLDTGAKTLRKEVLNRHCSDDRVLKATSLLKEAGVRYLLSAMFALPGETEEDMWQTVDMVTKLDPFGAGSYTIFPYPGTAFYHKVIRDGLIDQKAIDDINNGRGGFHFMSVINHPHAKLAMTITNIMPLYIKAPPFMRPMLKWIMKKKMLRFSYLCYAPLVLILYPKLSLVQAWNFIQGFLNAFRTITIDAPDPTTTVTPPIPVTQSLSSR